MPHSLKTMGSTYYSLHYHVVFSTRDRAPMIEKAWMDRLHGYLGGTVKGLGGVPHAIGGVEDHVHLLIGLKTTHCIADFMRDLKSQSSVWAQENLYERFGWQEGYAVFTVGRDGLTGIEKYIRNQVEHHRKHDFIEELKALLKKEGVAYDERYLV